MCLSEEMRTEEDKWISKREEVGGEERHGRGKERRREVEECLSDTRTGGSQEGMDLGRTGG